VVLRVVVCGVVLVVCCVVFTPTTPGGSGHSPAARVNPRVAATGRCSGEGASTGWVNPG